MKVEGPNREYSLSVRRDPNPNRNPGDYELMPADSLVVGGTYLDRRVTIDGIGAPIVAAGRGTRKDYQTRYTTKRIYANTTAVIQFRGHEAEIQFLQPFGSRQTRPFSI